MIAGQAVAVYLAFAWPGLFAAPLLRRAFPNLLDGGISIARPLGWLLITWFAFTLPSLGLAPYGNAIVVVGAVLLAAAGTAVAWLDRREWAALLRSGWSRILLGEALCALVFAVFVWDVQFNGDLHPLAERFMDYAILNRIGVTRTFPPLDAWMAGKTLSYYYYGYVIMDVLHRLCTPAVEMRYFFNLAIPGVFSAFCLALYGGGLALMGTRRAGVAALLGGAFFGNFDFARQAIHKRITEGHWSFGNLDWFHIARIIDGTINEVPAFSVFWGDLHPYFIAFPLVALTATLAIASVLGKVPPLDPSRSKGDRLLTLAMLGIPLGSLFPSNSWDFITFTPVMMAALAWPLLPGEERLSPLITSAWWFQKMGEFPARFMVEWREWLKGVVLTCGAVGLASVVLYLPFDLGFAHQAGRGVMLSQRRSDAVGILIHFGPWLAGIVLWAAATAKSRTALKGRLVPLLSVTGGLLVYELLLESYVASFVKYLAGQGKVLATLSMGMDHLMLRGLAFLLLIAALWTLLADLDWDSVRTQEGVARVLTCAALGLVLVVEFAFVRDFYNGENERMNTVFKVYIQAWILFGLGGAGLFAAGWRSVREKSTGLKLGFASVVAVVSICACSLIPLAEYSRSGGFQHTRSAPRPTWDGEKLFRTSYPADARAVDWVRANTSPDAVIAETTAHAYEWASRVGTFTGRLSVTGWKNHESGWRNDWSLAEERGKDLDRLYSTPDLQAALDLLHKYKVDYLYVGELERAKKEYKGGLAKFEAFPKAYSNEKVSIYTVPATLPAPPPTMTATTSSTAVFSHGG